jgi:hypothetical protein
MGRHIPTPAPTLNNSQANMLTGLFTAASDITCRRRLRKPLPRPSLTSTPSIDPNRQRNGGRDHESTIHLPQSWRVAQLAWWHRRMGLLLTHPIGLLGLALVGLSHLLSNLPAALLLEPVMLAMPGPARQSAWLSLAMPGTMAANYCEPSRGTIPSAVERSRLAAHLMGI